VLVEIAIEIAIEIGLIGKDFDNGADFDWEPTLSCCAAKAL